jgi:hypothetical protein
MNNFLNEFSGEPEPPYNGPYKAREIFKLTRNALLDSLSSVFYQIRKAAKEGLDYVDIKEDLSDDQRWILEKYEYDVIQYNEKDEEYDQGFRWHLEFYGPSAGIK